MEMKALTSVVLLLCLAEGLSSPIPADGDPVEQDPVDVIQGDDRMPRTFGILSQGSRLLTHGIAHGLSHLLYDHSHLPPPYDPYYQPYAPSYYSGGYGRGYGRPHLGPPFQRPPPNYIGYQRPGFPGFPSSIHYNDGPFF